MHEHRKLMLLTVIVDYEKSNSVSELLKKLGCRNIVIAHGKGTARSEMLTMLGLGENDKAVLMGVMREEAEKEIIAKIDKKLHLDRPGNGVAFTMDIKSVGGLKTLEYLYGMHIVGGK